jgi:nicotinamide mononucleotide transporter
VLTKFEDRHLLEELGQQFDMMQGAEIVALILAVAYVVLAARKSQWCWPAAAISTAIYTALFWHVSLVSESLLNGYYLVMAAWGWWNWRSEEARSFISEHRSLNWHGIAILACTLVALAWGYTAERWLGADLAYFDSATTTFAVFATWMLTQKIRANWLYWIVINLASIALYQTKGLYITSVLMMIYTVMAIVGWFSWKRDDDRHIATANA